MLCSVGRGETKHDSRGSYGFMRRQSLLRLLTISAGVCLWQVKAPKSNPKSFDLTARVRCQLERDRVAGNGRFLEARRRVGAIERGITGENSSGLPGQTP